MKIRLSLTVLLVTMVTGSSVLDAADWSRFRGPNGSGVSTDDAPLPTEWSETKNLKWKVELPGPGSSCPIVVGEKVFVTSWTGYADGNGEGSMEELERHLICLDRKTGKELWKKSVTAKLPEDTYRGMFAENGYATHTPVSDGEVVVAFFGKSGVHAYDMDGKELWNANVGTELDRRGWGSASSPVLYKNLVIVTASVENHAVVGLDKKTGKEVWKQEAEGFGSTWGTPVLVDVEGDGTGHRSAVRILGTQSGHGKTVVVLRGARHELDVLQLGRSRRNRLRHRIRTGWRRSDRGEGRR